MSKFKTVIAFISLIIMGFLAYISCVGIAALVIVIFKTIPVWEIFIGTMIGSSGILTLLVINKDKK